MSTHPLPTHHPACPTLLKELIQFLFHYYCLFSLRADAEMFSSLGGETQNQHGNRLKIVSINPEMFSSLGGEIVPINARGNRPRTSSPSSSHNAKQRKSKNKALPLPNNHSRLRQQNSHCSYYLYSISII